MNKQVTIYKLFEITGVEPKPKSGEILLSDRMEPPEGNPYNDWLYIGLRALKDMAQERTVEKAACIGTGQGIDAIAVAHLFKPKTLYVTDIVGELLELARQNIENNIQPNSYPNEIIYLSGKDCEPLTEKVDLITFSPPPLMVYNHQMMNEGIARTTLTEGESYLHLAKGNDDIKLKWSTLPQYGFLLSAKDKLNANGTVLTLYSGRIPFAATQSAYTDAEFDLKVRYQIIKRQTDPQYLKEYAKYEMEHLSGDTFDFYDFKRAQMILRPLGFNVPGIITGYNDSQIKELLKEAKISAVEAYQASLGGKDVAHIGYALEGSLV
jgi:methylase of polypeptide subunit release factors